MRELRVSVVHGRKIPQKIADRAREVDLNLKKNPN